MTFLSKRIAAAVAGTAMLVTPLAASAAPTGNPAASLSVARASTTTAHGSKLGASVPTTTLISIGILAALTAIVLVATNSNDNSDSK